MNTGIKFDSNGDIIFSYVSSSNVFVIVRLNANSGLTWAKKVGSNDISGNTVSNRVAAFNNLGLIIATGTFMISNTGTPPFYRHSGLIALG